MYYSTFLSILVFLFIYVYNFVLICVLFYSVYFMSLFCVLCICVFCVSSIQPLAAILQQTCVCVSYHVTKYTFYTLVSNIVSLMVFKTFDAELL